MKRPPINKRQASAVLLAIVALMLLDSLYQVGMHIRWRCWMPASLAVAGHASQPAADEAGAKPAGLPGTAQTGGPGASPSQPPKPHELAAAIKRRNIMAEPKPKGHGLTLTGVLGTRAFFQPRQGDQVAIEEGQAGSEGVKLLKIDGTAVTIEYEGKPETMKLFSGER